MGDGGGAQEIAPGFPEEVAVEKDMGEGVATAAVWAGGGIAGGGSELIRVVCVEGVTCDKLEACGLDGSRLSEEYALGELREQGGWVVMKRGVESTRVVALQPWAFRGPFRKHTVFGGERRGPRESEVGRLLVEGAKPVHLVRPCPSLGEVLP